MVNPSLEPTSREAKINYWKELARAYEDSELRYLYQVADLQDELKEARESEAALREDVEASERLIAYLRKQLRERRAA